MKLVCAVNHFYLKREIKIYQTRTMLAFPCCCEPFESLSQLGDFFVLYIFDLFTLFCSLEVLFYFIVSLIHSIVVAFSVASSFDFFSQENNKKTNIIEIMKTSILQPFARPSRIKTVQNNETSYCRN